RGTVQYLPGRPTNERQLHMPTQDLLQALHKQPFEPFSIHVSDGTVYEVYHPELVMVGLGSAVVGVPAPAQPFPVYQRYEAVALGHIVRLVPLPGTTAASD